MNRATNHPWYRRDPFRHLPAKDLARLQTEARARHLPKGSILFGEGEPAKDLWVIRSGWVRLIRRVTDGQDLTLDIVTPKDTLCGLSAFVGGPYMATAVAATPVDGVRLPAEILKSLTATHAELAACLARLLNRRYHHIAQAYAQAFASAQQRIASVLARLHEDFGMTLPVTRQEIARMSGSRVETAIRITRQMERNGVLRMSRGRIQLLRPDLLSISTAHMKKGRCCGILEGVRPSGAAIPTT